MAIAPEIVPCLWFDDRAEEAARFYTSVFPDSRIGAIARYPEEGFEAMGRMPGSVLTVEFRLWGRSFTALNGGPRFRFTPAASFYVQCETEAEVDRLWAALIDGGQALMELGAYDWSPRYGWLADRYGLSWQIGQGRLHEVGQSITPALMFTGPQAGRAEQALQLYTATFPGSAVDGILRVGPGEGAPEGHVRHAQFALGGSKFMVMDSSYDHAFSLNEAVSFQVFCDTQAEIDHVWDRLSEGGDPEAQRCGWLKDRFGVSWQVVPSVLPSMMTDPHRAARVTKAFLTMGKLDIAVLERAYRGEAAPA